MARVNIDRLFLALITKDEIGTDNLTFGTPEYIPSIREFNAKVTSTTEKLYAEGKVWDQDTTLEGVEIDFDLADFTNDQYAKYLGHHLAVNGGVYTQEDDSAPYVAVLYEATKSGGKKTYRAYYKGKLKEPDDNVKQKEGKTDFQTNKVTATFQSLKSNGMWKYQVDEDDPNAPADLATSFFDSVIIPGADTVAPTVTSVPLDSATGVSSSADVVFTFSKAIQASTINDNNILLMMADGTAVVSTLSVNDAKTVVTLHPTTILSAGSYFAIVTKNVKSASGVPLAVNAVVNFTV
jgi:phi13 family phage major tail protein